MKVRRSRSLSRSGSFSESTPKVVKLIRQRSINDPTDLASSNGEITHKRKLSAHIAHDSPVSKKATFFQSTIEEQAKGKNRLFLHLLK